MAILADKVDTKTGIDSAELAQRIAVLRRFKVLLTQQRDRFRSYLDILDKQKDVIESGNVDALMSYVEIEEKIIADIFSIQKVIDPLEEMYHSVTSNFVPGDSYKPEDAEVPSLKAALENLKSEAVIRSTKNKELLSKRMMEFRLEISALRNNPYAAGRRRSIFNDENTASLVDIHG
jgi:hypothetical protein